MIKNMYIYLRKICVGYSESKKQTRSEPAIKLYTVHWTYLKLVQKYKPNWWDSKIKK